MTLSRINHLGAAPATTLASSITAGATSLTLASGTGYPTSNFVIKLDAGTASEEKILVGSRSGTACSTLTRGYDGTTASSHSSGAAVEHDLAAVVIDDANDHVYTTTRDDHTQYARTDGTRAITGAQTFNNGVTVSAGGAAITGTVTVTSLVQTADDAAWTNVSAFTNSWTSSGGTEPAVGYRKVNGRVYLRGFITGGTADAVAFTLPTGYRPSANSAYACATFVDNTFSRIQVHSDGSVIPGAGGDLAGISFDLL